MKTFLLSSLFFIPFFLCAQDKLSEKNYRVYSSKLKKEVTLNEIIDDMKNYDVLFFGEEHNDSVTHYLESKMLELLFAKFNSNITLSMEMFDRDVQHVMNEYLNGHIREKHFNKDARIWSNYRDYKPMIEFAKSNKLDVICANAPTRYSNLAGRKGQNALAALSKESKHYFAPLPYDTASGKYYEKLIALTQHGASSAPVMQTMGGFNLIMAQSLWDATMAYSISEYLKINKHKKIMQVNGRFHSDEGFAIVTQLKKYRAKTKSLVISTGTDDTFPNIDWEKHQSQGDYIIITDPNIPRTYED